MLFLNNYFTYLGLGCVWKLSFGASLASLELGHPSAKRFTRCGQCPPRRERSFIAFFPAVATATPEKRSVEQNQNLLKLRAKTFFRHTLDGYMMWSQLDILDNVVIGYYDNVFSIALIRSSFKRTELFLVQHHRGVLQGQNLHGQANFWWDNLSK